MSCEVGAFSATHLETTSLQRNPAPPPAGGQDHTPHHGPREYHARKKLEPRVVQKKNLLLRLIWVPISCSCGRQKENRLIKPIPPLGLSVSLVALKRHSLPKPVALRCPCPRRTSRPCRASARWRLAREHAPVGSSARAAEHSSDPQLFLCCHQHKCRGGRPPPLPRLFVALLYEGT